MKTLRRIMVAMLLSLMLLVPAPQAEGAAIPAWIVKIIQEGVKKVIKAVDLMIQREQNKVIWLQNAQKVLENAMSKLKLEEISQWTERQRELYQDYFEELRKVKTLISYYQRIREITEIQGRIVREYQHAWGLISQDSNFSPQELGYMQQVYSGILDETVDNVDQLLLVINSFKTQMSDAKRLEIINEVAHRVETNYEDIRQFNQQNFLLRISRAKTRGEVLQLKKLYGFE